MVFSNQSVASLLGAGALKSVSATPPSTQATMPAFPPDQLNGQLSQGDLQWEVAGFHTYNQNGVAPQPPAAQSKNQSGAAINMVQTAANAPAQPSTVDIEVEISDRWPLKAPQAPNGLACGGTGFGNGLNVQDLSASGGDINNYPGDQWSLGGTVDLSRSPYQPGFTSHFAAPSPSCGNQCFGGDVTAVQFDNVFVDWGDGKVVPLTAPPASSNREPVQPNAACLSIGGQLQSARVPVVRGRPAARQCRGGLGKPGRPDNALHADGAALEDVCAGVDQERPDHRRRAIELPADARAGRQFG
jgi:hypothetical protein